ncbi:MAG: hypothetical protein ACOYK8_08005 [Alphaproteobacteria bacterium]
MDEGSDPKAFVPVADMWARSRQLSLIGAVAYGLMRETLSDITQPINLLEKPIAVLKGFAKEHEIIGHALVAACHPSMNHVQSEHDKEFHMATTVTLALAPLWQDIINNTPTNSTEWSGLGLIGEKIVQEFNTRLHHEKAAENTPHEASQIAIMAAISMRQMLVFLLKDPDYDFQEQSTTAALQQLFSTNAAILLQGNEKDINLLVNFSRALPDIFAEYIAENSVYSRLKPYEGTIEQLVNSGVITAVIESNPQFSDLLYSTIDLLIGDNNSEYEEDYSGGAIVSLNQLLAAGISFPHNHGFTQQLFEDLSATLGRGGYIAEFMPTYGDNFIEFYQRAVVAGCDLPTKFTPDSLLKELTNTSRDFDIKGVCHYEEPSEDFGKQIAFLHLQPANLVNLLERLATNTANNPTLLNPRAVKMLLDNDLINADCFQKTANPNIPSRVTMDYTSEHVYVVDQPALAQQIEGIKANMGATTQKKIAAAAPKILRAAP